MMLVMRFDVESAFALRQEAPTEANWRKWSVVCASQLEFSASTTRAAPASLTSSMTARTVSGCTVEPRSAGNPPVVFSLIVTSAPGRMTCSS